MKSTDIMLVPLILPVWLVSMVFLFGMLWQSTPAKIRAVLCVVYNLVALGIFCGLWYGGFYISEYWMHVIDRGAPWTWFGALLAISFVVSFLTLRRSPKSIGKSFIGPAITLPVFWCWIIFCAFLFDPFF